MVPLGNRGNRGNRQPGQPLKKKPHWRLKLWQASALHLEWLFWAAFHSTPLGGLFMSPSLIQAQVISHRWDSIWRR